LIALAIFMFSRAITLQNAGYIVVSATDPEEALRLLASEQTSGLAILGQVFSGEVFLEVRHGDGNRSAASSVRMAR
jgi:hypothetical protein